MKKIFILVLIIVTYSCTTDHDEVISIYKPTFDINLLLKGWHYDLLKINGTSYNYQHNLKWNTDFFGFFNRPR